MTLTGANLIESIYNDRVLLIESDPKMRSVYEEHLEFSGFEVHCANTLDEANNVLEYLPVNLIVSNEFLENGTSVIGLIQSLRKKGMNNTVILLTENEDRVWDQMPADEMTLQTFPVPNDLNAFLKSDVNQFISMVLMAIYDMPCIMIVNDSPSETVEMENILINNHFRVCSVQDGQKGLALLLKSLTTKHSVDLVLFTLINRYYPGLMFLTDLVQNSLNLYSILLTSIETTVDEIKEKTNYEVSRILPKSEISSQLIASIKTILNHEFQKNKKV